MKTHGLIALAILLMQGCDRTQTAPTPSPSTPPAAQTQRGNGQPYEILGSQVWSVPDPISKRDYQVFVQLPAGYEDHPDRLYPVLYVTDADYAFPVIRQISRRLNVEEPRIEDFILVGLSYAAGNSGMESRRRDYTPTPNGPKSAPTDAVHGEGPAYQTYLRDQVKPFIEQRFHVDKNRSLFLGHSYGALLGAQILTTEPQMFSGYILGSPSFWYDKRHILKMESAYAAAHKDLKASVYMYVGEYEAAKPGDPRFNDETDMPEEMRLFERALTSRHYPGLTLSSDILPDEDHVTVAPRGFTKGLLKLLPAQDREER